MTRTIRIIGAATFASALAISPLAARAQTLSNPGFESGLTGWTTFGNVYSDPGHAQSGLNGLKLYGNWSGAWNASGAFQTLAANPGETWTFTAYGLNASGDAVSGANQNFALLKIVWFDGPNGTGNVLQPLSGPGAIFGANAGIESQQLNASTAQDVWQLLSANGVAPAGTQSVQLFGGLFLQPNFEGGSLWFDNESLSVIPVPEPSTFALLALAAMGVRFRTSRAL